MTTTEIRKLIVDSNETEWFNSVEITIQYDHIGFEQSFKGVSSIHTFLSQQVKGWAKYDKIPNELNSSKQHFIDLKKRIENFVHRHRLQKEANLNASWRTEQTQLQRDNYTFTYDSAHTKFLIDLNNKLPSSVNGAYNYLIEQNNHLNDRNVFIGSLLAYEFDLKDKAEITQRRKRETTSLNKIKTDFRNHLSDSETDLVNHLKDINQKYDEYIEKIDVQKNEKEELFNNWFEGNEEIAGVKSIFNEFKKDKEAIFDSWFDGKNGKIGAKQKIQELENTYKELLKLKEPAEYWKERASKLRTQGWIAFTALIIFVGIVVWSLGELLWKTPEQIFTSFFEGDKSAAIRWSIIYVTFISFIAFCIRAITKVMFSSFHLARDSEERNTLTYFYLSLLNDSDVDKEERQLIMQSLFSRADTGLLKDDSGPTMPNDISGKIFGGR